LKKPTKNIASLHEVVQQLEQVNLAALYRKLVSFAKDRMEGQNIVNAEELVDRVFEKVISGTRNWDKNSYDSFEHFLFGAVRSLVYSYNKSSKHLKHFDRDFNWENLPAVTSEDEEKLEELRSLTMKILKNHNPPPDELEELVFECWLDGIRKPKEVAKFLEVDINEVNKAYKRLKRKMEPIRNTLKSSKNE